jgi:hypothetical protein
MQANLRGKARYQTSELGVGGSNPSRCATHISAGFGPRRFAARKNERFFGEPRSLLN